MRFAYDRFENARYGAADGSNPKNPRAGYREPHGSRSVGMPQSRSQMDVQQFREAPFVVAPFTEPSHALS